jgi:hypothetical protein
VTKFDFLSVLVSIVFGIGLTHLCHGVFHLAYRRRLDEVGLPSRRVYLRRTRLELVDVLWLAPSRHMELRRFSRSGAMGTLVYGSPLHYFRRPPTKETTVTRAITGLELRFWRTWVSTSFKQRCWALYSIHGTTCHSSVITLSAPG